MMCTKIKTKEKGFTLVELLIYAAATTILLGVLSLMLVQVYSLYKEITVTPRTDRSALLTIDRVLKDIRSGQSIDLASSSFGLDSGELAIVSVEDAVLINKVYGLSDGRITYQEDSGDVNFLTPSDVEITKFKFKYLTTGISQGVRVEIDISIPKKDNIVIKEYEGFSILRQSYE